MGVPILLSAVSRLEMSEFHISLGQTFVYLVLNDVKGYCGAISFTKSVLMFSKCSMNVLSSLRIGDSAKATFQKLK